MRMVRQAHRGTLDHASRRVLGGSGAGRLLHVTPEEWSAAVGARALMVITQRVTEYTLTMLADEDAPDAYIWDVHVVWTGKNRWAVRQGPWTLSVTGEWEPEPNPSNRTERWLATHRFSRPRALMFAREQVPKVTINGLSAADVLARARARARAKEE